MCISLAWGRQKFNMYLLACSDFQKHSPWGMKKVLLEMEDQRSSYEQKAKASLQKVLEEKMCAEQQLQRVQVEMLCRSRGWGPGSSTQSEGANHHFREPAPQIHPAF